MWENTNIFPEYPHRIFASGIFGILSFGNQESVPSWGI